METPRYPQQQHPELSDYSQDMAEGAYMTNENRNPVEEDRNERLGSERGGGPEEFREKGHRAAEAARSNAHRLGEQARRAGSYAEKIEGYARTAEGQVDRYIDTAERLLDRAAEYMTSVQHWLDEHPQYRERLMQMRQRGQDRGEMGEQARESVDRMVDTVKAHPRQALVAGAAAGLLIGAIATLMRR